MIVLVVIDNSAMRPKIDSDLKTQILQFYTPKLGLRWNYLIGSKEGTKNFTAKS